jgi:hypothetical protein
MVAPPTPRGDDWKFLLNALQMAVIVRTYGVWMLGQGAQLSVVGLDNFRLIVSETKQS